MSIRIFHTVFFAITIVFGIFPNAIVCLTYWKFRSLFQKSRNILICSLAFTNLMQSALALPLDLSAAIAGKWTAGPSGCKYYAFVCCWFGLSSILHIAALSAERWYTLSTVSLADPPKKTTKAFVLFVYIGTFLVSCCPLLGWSEYDYEGNGLHCSVKFASVDPNHLTFTFFLLIAFFSTSLLVIIVSGIKVYRQVQRICKNAYSTWGIDSPFTEQTYRSEVRMVKVISLMTIGFLLAWLPYVVTIFVKIAGHTISVSGTEIPTLLAKTSLAYNPMIYFFFYKKFRARMLHLLFNIKEKLRGEQPKRLRQSSIFVHANEPLIPMQRRGMRTEDPQIDELEHVELHE